MWTAGNQACKARQDKEETYLDGLKVNGGRKMAKRLSVIPNCFDGTELLREEFQDNLAIHYGLRLH